jgi:hypothetical protein
MSFTRYTFEDAAGQPYGTFETSDPVAAHDHGRDHQVRVIANEYEFTDSEMIADYTPGAS